MDILSLLLIIKKERPCILSSRDKAKNPNSHVLSIVTESKSAYSYNKEMTFMVYTRDCSMRYA